MAKIFVTGVTGYLGGDVVHALLKAHPEHEVTCLVRNREKGPKVAEAHPTVKIVYGDLEDGWLLEDEASKADMVCSKSSQSSTLPFARITALQTLPMRPTNPRREPWQQDWNAALRRGRDF